MAEVKQGKLPDAAVYVFQKLIATTLAVELRALGRIVVWDVCDPSWWFDKTGAIEAVNNVDWIVASSLPLAVDLGAWAAVNGTETKKMTVIPDRVELSHFDPPLRYVPGEPVKLIWYGIAANRLALFAAVVNLMRWRGDGHDISLTIFDDAPDLHFPGLDAVLPVTYERWTLDTEAETLAAHHIALLPPYPGPWGRVKSNNRTVTGLAAGLQVITGESYYDLPNAINAMEAGHDRREYVAANYNVEQSARQWVDLINDLSGGK
ncbi:MAG: hypothetical protein IPM49_18625 [Flavobacteriales bacterium]|nr:hypothetical protein [Flavobacteriales bacterium]